ncbi:UNVERIFIED_CONTAM: hypothetical protein RMT77_015576 [Armadillidium vulgare]
MGSKTEKSFENSVDSITTAFKKMSYGPAVEDRATAEAWLNDHNRKFGHFIDNTWICKEGKETYASLSPSDGSFMAETIQGNAMDVDFAVFKASEAFSSWSKLAPHARAKYLYSIARHIQKHSTLLAVIESLDNGKPIRESKECDIPLVVRHFYYHAGWAQVMDSEMKDYKPVGVVGAIVPWNFPLMLLAWKVCPALAMGNTVVLKPATRTRLSALLFAEICAEAGLPAGVFNVITGNGEMGSLLAKHPNVHKVAFTGSTEVGKHLRQLTAGTGKKLSLELGGKSPIIVYESADLDSAIEGIVDAIFFNQGQVCSAGSRLLVQESVYNVFIGKLKDRMKTLRVGPSLDKACDVGCIIDEQQKSDIDKYVQLAKKEGAEVFQINVPDGCYYPPTLITGIGTVSRCFMEEIFGPVLVALPFRTSKEAISLANNTIYGLGSSVFTEKLPLALETAKLIKAGTVWINCHNMFDAAAGFGGYKQSGYGRDGGKEGLYEYVIPKWEKIRIITPSMTDVKNFGGSYVAGRPALPSVPSENCEKDQTRVDITYKLYYGGGQKRPDAGYSRVVQIGNSYAEVPESNRKDVRNAVECAQNAQQSWAKRTGFNRSQILYYFAENLSQRREELTRHLSSVTGASEKDAEEEINVSVSRLFHWAAFSDKYGGEVQETTLYGTVLKVHEALGVIGIACPEEAPLLGFISLVAPAIARGNTVVAIPCEKYPTIALGLYQVFETSDVPAGVVNILTGSKDHLTKYLTEHQDVQAMWYFGTEDGSTFVENVSSTNLKRTWVNYGLSRNWCDQKQGQGEEFLRQSTQVKNIWLTMGEIFAN